MRIQKSAASGQCDRGPMVASHAVNSNAYALQRLQGVHDSLL
jgi:hypothetical protein